jgi:hypothetical protein
MLSERLAHLHAVVSHDPTIADDQVDLWCALLNKSDGFPFPTGIDPVLTPGRSEPASTDLLELRTDDVPGPRRETSQKGT